MKYLTILYVAFLIVGCSDQTRIIVRTETVCDKTTVEKRAEFILQCIINANPKSDEEPEDWITKCQWMAERTYCEKKNVEYTEFRPALSSRWRDTTYRILEQ